MSCDPLVIGKLGNLAQTFGFHFVDDGALGFGIAEEGVETIVVAQSGCDPDAVEGATCFEGGLNGMTTIDHVALFFLGVFRFGRGRAEGV